MDAHTIIQALLVALGLPLVLQRPLFGFCSRLIAQKGMSRPNYRGEQVLTAGGLVLVASMAVTVLVELLLLARANAPRELLQHGLLLVCGMAAMACWGWMDDKAGDAMTKGFRGHFAALLREGRVTSGMCKLFGGGDDGCRRIAVRIRWLLAVAGRLRLAGAIPEHPEPV
ncbi:hypothetical protein [Brevibacillus gelatini]